MAILLTGCSKKTVINDRIQPVKPTETTQQVADDIKYDVDETVSSREYSSDEIYSILKSYRYGTSDDYINNKDLCSIVDPDLLSSEAIMVKDAMERLYNINSVSVSNDTTGYMAELYKDVSKSCVVDGEDFIASWLQAVKDSDAGMSATFTTNGDQVFYDNGELCVRGMLTLKVNAAADTDQINKMLPTDVKVGNIYNFVYDIGIVTDKDIKTADATTESSETATETQENETQKNRTEEMSSESGKIDHIYAVAVY